MGLLNISHKQMTQSIVDLQADLLKNPFYLFNDKRGTLVEYYNINSTKSTLDPSLKISYADRGRESSLRYNLIHDFYIYGIDRVSLSLENTDITGVESSEITGEAVILPDTITPYAGDYFVIKMVKQKYVFLVTAVSSDTFDNGGNYWKLEYQLRYLSEDGLIDQVVEEYNFVSGNVGSNYNAVLQKTKWDVCKNLDDVAVSLKNIYRSLFFNDKVQTYTFVYLYRICRSSVDSDFFYDPYMIEFCIKNKVLSNSGYKYDFLDHKTSLRPEFGIKYSKSIWKILETREKNELPGCRYISTASYINDPGTIFATRYENYFELTYDQYNQVAEMFASPIEILDSQIIGHILENQLFTSDSMYAKYNILIKYFNHGDIGIEDIIPYEHILENDNDEKNYFLIPMVIYIMEVYIKEMMVKLNK